MKKKKGRKEKLSAFLGMAVFSTSYISSQISTVTTYLNANQMTKPLKNTSAIENNYVIKKELGDNINLPTQSSDFNKNTPKIENKTFIYNVDKKQIKYYNAIASTSTGSSINIQQDEVVTSSAIDLVGPSIKKIYTESKYGSYSQDLNNGKTGLNIKDIDKIIIEFDDNDVIKKDINGSSVYAGIGKLPNELMKLEKLNNANNTETVLDLSGVNNYGNNIVKLVDNTESGENDKIIIDTSSSMNMEGLLQNSAYKLLIENITDEAGNKIRNPQILNFSTGPAPVMQLNREESNVENFGSSINYGSLITDIKVDGSYGGFVLDTGYSDTEDKLTNVNTNTIKIYENGSGTLVGSDKYEVSLSSDRRKITIKPNVNGLQKSKMYEVVVNGVTDIEGNPIGNYDGNINNQYRFYFQTGDGTVLSVGKVYMTYDEFGMYKNKERDLKDGATGVFADQNSYYHNIVIEFNDNDIIKKNSLGSSVYAGNGILINDLIKLVKVNNLNGNETQVDLSGKNRYGYEQVRLLDNTDLNSEGKDKIIISANSSVNMPGIIENSKYKLIIGDIINASGNIISNPQSIKFVTGPSPMLGLNKAESNVDNIGSSINAGSLITDIKIDGSYSGFIVEAVWSNQSGYADLDDKLSNVNANTVKIYENSTPIGSDKYEVSLSGDGKQIIIKPNANGLQKNKTYEVVVNGVTDIEGNPIGNHDGTTNNQYRFYFQTGDEVAPSVGKINTAYAWGRNIYNESEVKNGDKGVWTNNNSVLIEFNDTDVIKKNSLGSSIYAGVGVIENNLIKLTRVDNETGEEKAVNLGDFDRYGNRGIQFIDDSESYGNGKDKIVITPMSSMSMVGLLQNTTYKLSIGNITDASGNVISNAQNVSFTTGPAPVLNLNREDSGVGNTGSSIDAGKLITDIRVDGSYSGFVVDAGYSDVNDKLSNVNANTVKIYENSTPIGSDKYEVSLSGDGKKITIKPNANGLQKNKTYAVVVNGVTDIEGNPIRNFDGSTNNQYRFYFQTGDKVAPSVGKISTASARYGSLYNEMEVKNGDKGVWTNNNSVVIEFTDKDVIKKNSLGSSIYAGVGVIENNLIKLTRVDNETGEEKAVNIGDFDRYGNRGIQLIDDSDSYGNGKDKIVITPMSSMSMVGLIQNSTYKLSIGNITDASGNVINNAQNISFTTGPSPVLNINREESGVGNTGSSIDAGKLITDIRVDGSYSGFVLDAGYSDVNDKLSNVNANTVKIYENGSSMPIGSAEYGVSLSADGKKITIKPNANGLQKNKTYEVVVNGVTDIEGNPIGNFDGSTKNQYKFYFQTGDEVAPSVRKISTVNAWYGSLYNEMEVKNGDKGVWTNNNSVVIEFNDTDVIKKNSLGSSVYAGTGILENNLIKLTRVDNETNAEKVVNIGGFDRYGNRGIQLIDDSESYGNGKDKIVITPMSSMNMVGLIQNSTYKLSIGNITDASGNVINNAQNVSFTTGPSPVLQLNREESNVNNIGSSLNAGSLITDIRVDGSYSGFVVDAGQSDINDKLSNVNANTVKIYENGSTTPIGSDKYTVRLSGDGKKIIIKPNANGLQKNKTYVAVVNGVTDIEGNPIGNFDGTTNNQYRFYFQTGDEVAPSIGKINAADVWGRNIYNESEVKNGDKGVLTSNNSVVIEFNDTDVIKKNSLGSSIYAGTGILENNLIKLTRVDNETNAEKVVNIGGADWNGNRGIQLIDDSDSYGNGKDKIVITPMSSMSMVGLLQNSTYKLSIGNITDASGNVINNAQNISFTTGPSPVLNINREESGVGNTGSSIDAGKLITDIRVDGSYSGFVLDAGYSDVNDKLSNVNANTVKIYENGSSTPIGSAEYGVSLSTDGKKITIKPNANGLQKNKTYAVVVNGVTDIEGNPIGNHDGSTNNQYRFYFQTGDEVAPSVGKINTAYVWGRDIYNENEVKNGDKGVWTNNNSVVIEFNDTDVIKKNSLGSSVYAGTEILENNLIKLTRVDNETNAEKVVNIGGFDRYGNKGIQLIDDSESYGNGKDKIVITPMSSMNMVGLLDNTTYKLSIGNITDASGNVISNAQEISFTIGPAPVLNLNREESGVGNTGSSIDAGKLITDIRVDGSYSGFVLDAGYSDVNDKLSNVNANTVKIYENNTPVGSDKYAVSLSGDGKKITIKPNANGLQKNKTYAVVVNGVTDIEGNPIGNHDGSTNNQYRFYFQTGDEVVPSVGKVYASYDYYGHSNQIDLHNGDKDININKYVGSVVIEFNDTDVIKKNSLGSSVYAGNGTIVNNLIKLAKINPTTGEEILLNLEGNNRNCYPIVSLEDDSDYYARGKDKIVIRATSSINMAGIQDNFKYTLTIGNITDASGNVVSNPQKISFVTGPSPVLSLDTIGSRVNNTGSGLDAASLITNIKVDGSYSGFVLGENNDAEDKLTNVTANTVKIYEEGTAMPLGADSYEVNIVNNGRSISIVPNANKLQKGKVYSVVVNGVTDLEGNPIINRDSIGNVDNQYRFYFKTEESIVQPTIPPVVVPPSPIPSEDTIILSKVTPATVIQPTSTEIKQAKTINIATQQVIPNKTWNITFTKEIDVKDSIVSNIIVLDSNGKIVPVKVNVLSDKKSITIIPASGEYNTGESYILYINKNIDSAEGKNLKSSYKINFTITN